MFEVVLNFFESFRNSKTKFVGKFNSFFKMNKRQRKLKAVVTSQCMDGVGCIQRVLKSYCGSFDLSVSDFSSETVVQLL
jgi:hypothetical protein